MARAALRAACRPLLCLTALLGVSQSNSAHAGPWPQPEGHGLLISSFGFTQAQNHAGVSNPAYGNGVYQRFGLGLYGEYGVTDRITVLGAGGPQLRSLDTAGSTAGMGDVDLAIRGTFWQEEYWAGAVEGIVKVPTSYDAYVNPALGNGQVDLEPRLLIGRGLQLGSLPAFAILEAGYRFRTGGPSDQLRLDATFGVHVAPAWMILVQSFNIIGMQNQDTPGCTDFSLSTLFVSMVYEFSPRWAVQVGGTGDIATRNYNGGYGAFAAIWWRF